MKRYALVLVLALAIGGVAGARYLLRDENLPASAPLTRQGEEVKPTGRTVPVDVDPLPQGLVQDGTFRCAELRRDDGTYTARAEGASIRNASKETLDLSFTFTVVAGQLSEEVGRAFTMTSDQKAPSFLMASKSLPRPITRCRLRLDKTELEVAPSVQQAASRAGCTGPAIHPDEGQEHIADGQRATYSTTPPTSGRHYAKAGRTGVHTQTIPNETQVHNLEHGHIGLQHRDAGSSANSVLNEAAQQDPERVFTAPYPNMEAEIALTAWRVSVTCAKAPADRAALVVLVSSFIDAYKSRAPENIPGAPA